MVFDKIASELSGGSVLNLALAERKMFEDLQPAMRKRMFMTPKQDTTFMQSLPIYSHCEQFNNATSHLVCEGPICFTGCCSPSLTVVEESLGLIRRYKTSLGLGDSVKCIVRFLDPSTATPVGRLALKVVKSKT